MTRFFKNSGRRYHPPFPDPVTVVGLRRLINNFRPEIVHATGWIGYSCAAALLGKNILLVVSMREYGYSCAVRTIMHKGQVCDGPALTKCLNCATDFYGKPKGIAAALGVYFGRGLLKHKLRGTHGEAATLRDQPPAPAGPLRLQGAVASLQLWRPLAQPRPARRASCLRMD